MVAMVAMVAATTMVLLWEASDVQPLAAGPICFDKARCQMTRNYSRDHEYHYKVEGNEMIIKIDGNSFEIDCCFNKVNIGSASLPKFFDSEAFAQVSVINCLVPYKRITSYAMMLAALNVTVLKELFIESPVMDLSLTSLSAEHFARLNLETLEIKDGNYLNVTYDCFTNIRGLKKLTLQNVNLPATISVKVANGLQYLRIEDTWPLPVKLKSVKSLNVLATMKNKDKQELRYIEECDKLERIAVTARFARSLPDRWLVNCNNLKKLLLNQLTLKTFSSKVVSEKNSLTFLKVRSCGLSELSEDAFKNMAELRNLDLSQNLLTNLQSKVFEPLLHLERLELSNNKLRMLGDSWSLTNLRYLSLTNNPLRDICSTSSDTTGLSVLADLSSLESLILNYTLITRLCPDWRSMPHLKELNLSHNNISRLQYDDLLFFGNEETQVDISGNPVKQILFTKRDYNHALNRERDEKIERKDPVDLYTKRKILVECDCNAYWFARIQCERDYNVSVSVARVSGILCDDDKALCDSASTVCAIGECTPHCTCEYRASDNATVANCSWSTAEINSAELPRANSLVVYAERSELTSLLDAPNAIELHLQRNHIQTIHFENIYDHLRVLDLRINDIRRIDLDAVKAIFSNGNRRVWLSGNPLACDCQHRSFLDSLRNHSVQIADYKELECADKRFLRDINTDALCDSSYSEVLLGLLVASFVLVSFVVVLVIVNISNFHYNTNKQFSEWKQSEKRYDIFISFSYENMELVQEKLLPWLEEPSRAYRVCVNYRDWEVPELIHKLIKSSVRDSSCTLALVSEHYLKSKRTRRTEFRTAHAAAILDDYKLVVILLRPVTKLRSHLDDELRTYLEHNTYLVWGDRWFWKKLQAALPPPPTTINSSGHSQSYKQSYKNAPFISVVTSSAPL